MVVESDTLKLKGTRALVTGGAGFIGSELVHQLADAGAEVTVLDNLVNGKRENVDDSARLEIVDVRDRNLTVLPPSSVATRLRAVVQMRKRQGCAPY